MFFQNGTRNTKNIENYRKKLTKIWAKMIPKGHTARNQFNKSTEIVVEVLTMVIGHDMNFHNYRLKAITDIELYAKYLIE